jgi:hypothetical protein
LTAGPSDFGLFRRLTGDGAASGRTWVPAVDVFRRDDDLVVRAELPGIDRRIPVQPGRRAEEMTAKGTDA